MKIKIILFILSFSFASFAQKSFSPTINNNYDLKYHRCEWKIDPSINYINGNITSFFTPNEIGVDSISFNLSDEFTVDSVLYQNGHVPFELTSDDLLNITLPTALAFGSIDSVTVFYQGVPPDSADLAFHNDTHNGTAIAWTLSEPFGAKNWWPCKQSLNDKIDSIDIIVTTPSSYKVASNGLLISETVVNSNTIFHWKSNYPTAAYLIGIAITDYTVYTDTIPLRNGDTLSVINYVYPESYNDAVASTPQIKNIIHLFDSLTVPYPFANEKYGHAQFNWGGGMEHQTMSFVVDFSFPLLAHECAHQWFGDHVTCGSWQDIWLNESFATYFEGLATENYFPEVWLTWKEKKIENIITLPGGSVLCDDTTSASRILDGRLTYDKGAYLLHMLRWKLGDSLFFLSIKKYVSDSTLTGGYAYTSNLIEHFENTANQSLNDFFDQWYYQQGYPSYNISWSQSKHDINLTVNQSQSHASVSFFDLPIEVKFIGAYKDTSIIFNHSYSGQEFKTAIDFPVIQVKFDPNRWILSGGNTISEIPIYDGDENQVMIYPNPTKDILNILSLNNSNTIKQVVIIDATGKIVFESENYTGINKHISIDTSTLIDGIYHIKFYLKTGVNYRKFVKTFIN